MSRTVKQVAIIGSGPSSLFLLKELLSRVLERHSAFKNLVVTVLEKEAEIGLGMPYHPRNTDLHNICNITSEEIPELVQSFAAWLRSRDRTSRQEMGVYQESIEENQLHSRVALGCYFQDQWRQIVAQLRQHGVVVVECTLAYVIDIIDSSTAREVRIVLSDGRELAFDRIIIAVGHSFDCSVDEPQHGYFASPWPIHKLLPPAGSYYDFPIGILGASLSAFDVVTSVAHRHGRFEQVGDALRFHLHPQAEGFRIDLHASNGWLPHIQYEQREAFRKIYRYCSREEILAMRDQDGFLRLEHYFDRICRPALSAALRKDGRHDLSERLTEQACSLEEFVDQMTAEHTYADAFEGMRRELPEARRSVEQDRPICWKEALDDLMYALNYHAELLPAEDHLRFRSVVMPFLMNVIAALPIPSVRILLALRDAGIVDLQPGYVELQSKQNGETTITITNEQEIAKRSFSMFVDCGGQEPMQVSDYPFPSLVRQGRVRAAQVRFADPTRAETLDEKHRQRVIPGDPTKLKLDGIDIDSLYHVIDDSGQANPRIQLMAYPHTTGIRPYSYGLQACDDTAALVMESWEHERGVPPLDGSIEKAAELYEDIQQD